MKIMQFLEVLDMTEDLDVKEEFRVVKTVLKIK